MCTRERKSLTGNAIRAKTNHNRYDITCCIRGHLSIHRCRIIISRFDYFLFDLAPHLASYYPRFSYHRCSTPSHFIR